MDTFFAKRQVHSWEYMRSDIHRWRFFQIINMRSKSKAGTTLDRISWEAGVKNEISMDNAPEQTCYNTEIQKDSMLARMEVYTSETHYPWKIRPKAQ